VIANKVHRRNAKRCVLFNMLSVFSMNSIVRKWVL
jgi:hypothetical protein